MKYLLILLIIFAKPMMVDALVVRVHHEIIIPSDAVTQVLEADNRTPVGIKNRVIRPLKSNSPSVASPTPSKMPSKAPKLARLYTDAKEKMCREQTAYARVKEQGIQRFGIEQWDSLEKLVCSESGFYHLATNGSSGACGLFQAYPCSKIACSLEDIDCQIAWGLGYIERRYGTPSAAWSHWLDAPLINGKNVGHWY